MASNTLIAACLGLCGLPVFAAAPSGALAAFSRYAAAVEQRIQADSVTPGFLRALPDESTRARARGGEVLVASARLLGIRPDLAIPGAQIQHWVGAAFLPGATLEGILPRLRNYDNRARYMSPEIVASRLTDREGDLYRVYLRLVEKAVLSGVFDLNLRIVYRTPRPGRLSIESRSVSVAAVPDVASPVGTPARDPGLLWALNHYWRIEEADGGLYVECEALVLARPTPFLLSWIARPLIAHAARDSLLRTIHATLRIMNSPDAAE